MLEPLRSGVTWTDLKLPASSRATLSALAERGTRGRVAIFSGPPGTGKTLAAEALATRLHLAAYRIDLSRVVSKYIGETEKHIDAVFDDAEAAGAVLLFDEADALFGKRTGVGDAHDRYANSEIACFLARLERFSGIAILATTRPDELAPAVRARSAATVPIPRRLRA